MSATVLVGTILVVFAILDLAIGFFVVLPRLAEDRTRSILRRILVIGSAFLLAVGVALLLGVPGGTS